MVMSVNLSVRQFYQDDLVPMISRILEETELDPHYLELEITETMTMNVDKTLTTIHELKRFNGLMLFVQDTISSPTMTAMEFGPAVAGQGRAGFVLFQCSGPVRRNHAMCNSVYSLAKAAVVHFTQAIAVELAPEVRINAIAPDLISENEDNPKDLVERTIAASPLYRLVSRKEIAEMVCLLCSSAFDFVTGQTLIMDGGHSIHSIR